jgi:hypothetical protein
MSDHDHNQGAGQNAQQPKAAPLHQPFSWLHTDAGGRSAKFIERVLDVSGGLNICLNLVHSTDLVLHAREWGDDDAAPLLGTVDKERLLRLAIAATDMLSDLAHGEVQWINDQARKAEKETAR